MACEYCTVGDTSCPVCRPQKDSPTVRDMVWSIFHKKCNCNPMEPIYCKKHVPGNAEV